jgi:hypothetical protein
MAQNIFHQGVTDGIEHTLLTDEITVDDSATATIDASNTSALPAPTNVLAKGYERHVDVQWDGITSPEVRRYIMYRSLEGGNFEPVGIQTRGLNRFTDCLGKPGLTARYKVATSDRKYHLSTFSNEARATTTPLSDEELRNFSRCCSSA